MTAFAYKLTKEVKRELKKMASTLPPTFLLVGEYRATNRTKTDIRKKGAVSIWMVGNFTRVDHYKELCDLYRKTNDASLVKGYIDDVNSIITPETKIGKIGSFATEFEFIKITSKYIAEGDDDELEEEITGF